MKEKIAEYEHESSSSSKIYKVIMYDDGSFSCNCPSWIFKRGEVRGCKHIEEVKCEEVNVNISGLNKPNEVVKEITTSHD